MLLIIVTCVVLVGAGVVHGIWTDRWSDQSDLADASKRLQELPMTIGSWHGNTIEMEKDPKSGLSGMIARRYVHASTGKGVTLFLACGRAGPVCMHTPDVCYVGNGYEVEKAKRFQLRSTTAQSPPEFWTARFVKERANGKIQLRIFWSWHASENWQVADNPRRTFARERVLYKMYLIRELLQPDEPLDGDACVEFMHDLLPMLQRSVFAQAK
jgi:hypothetical protein